MTKIALLGVMVLSVFIGACSSKTEALANKSLMSRPLLHHSSASEPAPSKHAP